MRSQQSALLVKASRHLEVALSLLEFAATPRSSQVTIESHVKNLWLNSEVYEIEIEALRALNLDARQVSVAVLKIFSAQSCLVRGRGVVRRK